MSNRKPGWHYMSEEQRKAFAQGTSDRMKEIKGGWPSYVQDTTSEWEARMKERTF